MEVLDKKSGALVAIDCTYNVYEVVILVFVVVVVVLLLLLLLLLFF